MHKPVTKSFVLSPESIDEISLLFSHFLEETECDRKDVIRLRLSLEEILESWLGPLEGAEVEYNTYRRMRKDIIQIRVKGAEVREEDAIWDYTLSSRLLSQAGLSILKSYSGGYNTLSLEKGRKSKNGQLKALSIAIALSVVLGLAQRTLPVSVRDGINSVLNPIFSLILNALTAISSPMIFLAITWGIFSIGDITTLGKVGKKVISNIVITTFSIALVMTLILMCFSPITSNASDSSGSLMAVYQMILDIVPSDIISPFLNGNTLQVIFLGVTVGIALLVLGERVANTRAVIEQMNEVVGLIMTALSKVIPLFVFLSLYSLMGSDFSSEILGILSVVLFTFVISTVITLFFILVLSLKYKVSFLLLLKKLLPTYVIGLTTASSAAAFATNMETCEKKLGIETKLTHFTIPLSQVIFKPSAVVGFSLISVSMARMYSVNITPVWFVTMALITALLSMAAPPIPGGALTCYTVMFTQLSIPVEAVAIAVALNSVMDFIMTANNLTCLQTASAITAGKLNMLDTTILKKEL